VLQEVFVGQVAPADDGERAVGDQQLVVHAVIQAAVVPQRVEGPAERAFAPAGERVVQANFDVRHRAQSEQQRVQADRVRVVDEQPHAHAALARVAQLAQQRAADAVVADQVGLHVDRRLRSAQQFEPRVEREVGLRQRAKSRLTGLRLGPGQG
jgi:sulfur carrier protein ThiS